MTKTPKILSASKFIDDRGTLLYSNDFNFSKVKRFYMIENHDINFIRAWHGHEKEAKYVQVLSGVALVGVVPLHLKEVSTESDVTKTILSYSDPSILYIPPGYYNGFMNLEHNTKIMFYSTTTVEESKGDDIRLSYDHWNIWEKNYR